MKKQFLISVIFALCASIFAMPGFESYIPDSSGDYVFYRDYSFSRESYIGLLCYNDSTFQIKYYAPADKNLQLPEESVAIAVTINPQSNFWDMTGERILTTVTQDSDELEILNYLHDILYDFSSIRKKAGNVSPESPAFVKSNIFKETGVNFKYDYPQFGGNVNLLFDPVIPLFNLKSITGQDGIVIFECVATGTLSSSTDTSFDKFQGMIENYIPKTTSAVKKGKSAKYTTQDNQTITLDSNWTQIMENCWSLGDQALITMSSIPLYFENQTKNSTFIIRQLIKSSQDSYNRLDNLELLYLEKTNQFKITSDTWQPSNKKVIKNTRYLNLNDKSVSYFSLAAFADDFSTNLNYYNKILKSYQVK